MENLAIAGSGNPLRLSTYDFLCITSHELQASSEVMNSVARVALSLFPEKIEYIDREFIPNMWMGRVMVQTANGEYLMVDGNLWFDCYYYLKYFSGVNLSNFTYSGKFKLPFPTWFESKTRDFPFLDIQTDKHHSDIPKTPTREYVDIMVRLNTSIYVLDAFGSGPRETIKQNQNQNNNQNQVVDIPTQNTSTEV